MAEFVEAGAHITFQNPLWGMLPCSHIEALLHGIRRCTLLAEPVGIRIAPRLRDGIKREQIEGLHGSVMHRGNRQGAPAIRAARLWDRDAPERLSAVAALPQFLQGARFLRRGVPKETIHPRGLPAIVFRHPSDRKGLAAERVGQEMLQGTHLAPSSCLHCLHNTRLEPPHRAVYGIPIDGVPCDRCVGKCTSPCGHGCHLPSLLWRLPKLSCDERPEGRQPAFACGDVALGSTPIHPMTGWPSLFPSSHARTPMGSPCGSLSLPGDVRGCHVPSQ